MRKISTELRQATMGCDRKVYSESKKVTSCTKEPQELNITNLDNCQKLQKLKRESGVYYRDGFYL